MSLTMIAFGTQDEWERWLAENHTESPGVWMKIAKKGADASTVSYAEALDSALCYGWIDGQKGKLDDEHWLQRFTPRRPRSKWSQRNRDHVDRLISEGRMTPAGLREVEQARADGRWDAAYEGQAAMTVPDDLLRALELDPIAEEFFSTLDRANVFAIVYRIQDAKKPETRARRIDTIVAMLGDRKKIH
ncbi:hypothetical protein Pth03_56430 [Planotetraspora thailandica]|uniref:Bacteriocin-protection protein, YdeI/OmpD-associated family n=1 Tax=Planotetraspora thailandica TaxID=487172 RepID=A0A8J3VAI8_9ACTN|nr:YdeI/OmpD-associated family protein [Planotetraspora thailandica]GII57254.1 hypothetical protein Pth03_56430 [Planotetraspora thailandica]